MYGGDITRKMKLWAKQKKGKARMKALGKVNLDLNNLKEFLKNSR
jgi:GTP-binding protein LepA